MLDRQCAGESSLSGRRCCVRVLGWPLSRRSCFSGGRFVFLLLNEHCEFLTSGRSVHEVAWAGRVDLLEGNAGAFVEDALGLEALVLVVTVGSHAGSEGLEVSLAELVEDILTGGTFVFSREATMVRRNMTY